ncbi:MAG: PCRF domain-containing protein, partial [Candidatus Dormiibacterota bacterium]
MIDRLDAIAARYHDLEREMSDPDVLRDHERVSTLGRELHGLEDLVGTYADYQTAQRALEEVRELAHGERDAAMQEYVRQEERATEQRLQDLQARLRELLVPKDPNDERDVVVDIQGAEGGQEAALFAADLFRMYSRWAERKGLKIEVVESQTTELGGFDKIVFEVHGQGAYSQLKFEGGVHRVQRVPVTESQGRVHTSAATVSVMPEPDPVEIELPDKDLKIETSTSTGP